MAEEWNLAGPPATPLDFDDQRIRHLTGGGPQNSRIVVVGLGSGGFPVLQHLAMSGWRRFTLIDPDQLESVNLVKYQGLRNDQGRMKMDIAAEWLAERKPHIQVVVDLPNVRDLAESEMSRLDEKSELI